MSKFLKLFGPAFVGSAVVLGGAFLLADRFVSEVPAPLIAQIRDREIVLPEPVPVEEVAEAPAEATGGEAAMETGSVEVADAAVEGAEGEEIAVAPAADAADEVVAEAPVEDAAEDAGDEAIADSSAEQDPEVVAVDAPADAAAEGVAAAPETTADAGTRQGDPMPETVAVNLGRPATEDEIAAWDIDVRPDGQGLPVGSGDVLTGETLYTEHCSSCHGVFGEAIGRWPVLAGGFESLTNARPVKTVGSYWPFASTVFDYVHRAMPFGQAQTLTDDEVYAIVAQLLYLNDLVDEDFVLSNENLGDVVMPNAGNFFPDDRAEGEIPAFTREVCMSDCKDAVEITARAAVIDVTPEDAAARERLAAAMGEDGGGSPAAEAPVADDAADDSAEAGAGDEAAEVEADEGMASTDVATTGEDAGSGETADAADPDLIAAGETVFRKCKACHQVGEGAKNRTGPHLNDLFGRPAAALDGFKYSDALAEEAAAGLVWTDNTLGPFVEDPRGYIRGTKMSFNGLRDAADVEALLAYLRTFDE